MVRTLKSVRTGSLAVWTGNFFLVRKAILEFLQGLPDANTCRPDNQFTLFFVSFPLTPISSQSNIWVKRYDQNTGGRPDGLIERPDGQLQPLFQNSTESFHNKAASGWCCPSIQTVALRLHVISIIRL
jgi:hypothetical protein